MKAKPGVQSLTTSRCSFRHIEQKFQANVIRTIGELPEDIRSTIPQVGRRPYRNSDDDAKAEPTYVRQIIAQTRLIERKLTVTARTQKVLEAAQ